MMNQTQWRGRRQIAAAIGAGIAIAVVLSGCSRADTAAESDGGTTVDVGSSAEAYQEALADMEEVTLTFQVRAASAESAEAASDLAFVKRIEEFSGGKITVDIAWAYGIESNPVETDKALADGRIDIGTYWPQYKPSEYPVNNLLNDASVLRDAELVPGYFAIAGALDQTGFQTPEVLAEFTDKGITPLVTASPGGPSVLICREPLTTLADLEGKQIRSGGTAASRELEGLGAIPVAMPFSEIYEGLQRGIIDCALEGHALATLSGHLEVAPWAIHTSSASFAATPSNLYAGPKFKSLPTTAQQLIMEAAQLREANRIEEGLMRIAEDALAAAEKHGGGFVVLDSEVDEKLSEINETILDDIAASDLFDGKAFVKRVTENNDAWNRQIAGLGYENGGEIVEIEGWFAEVDGGPWSAAMLENVVAPRFEN